MVSRSLLAGREQKGERSELMSISIKRSFTVLTGVTMGPVLQLFCAAPLAAWDVLRVKVPDPVDLPIAASFALSKPW